MMRPRPRSFGCGSPAAVLLALCATVRAADLGTDAYQLPLIDSFQIRRGYLTHGPDRDLGTYQLVTSDSFGSVTVVKKLARVALRDRLIFGTADGGFFLVDATDPDPKPVKFATTEAWRDALRAGGIESPDALLASPDALAAAVPEQTLRPWRYRVMNGRLGMDDDTWSLCGQTLSLAVALLVGRCLLRRRSSIRITCMLGAVLAMVSHIIVDGQGAFLLLLFGPILYALATGGRSGLDGESLPLSPELADILARRSR